MKKIQRAAVKGIAIATASIIAVSPVFAAGWQQDASGWWYGTNADNTTWYNNGWQWIDGNGDGTAECYYFGADGYLYQGGTTPEGYTVNADGAWTENGIVQTKNVSAGTTSGGVSTEASAGSASGSASANAALPKLSDSATPDNMLALTAAYDSDGYYILNAAKSDGKTLTEYASSDKNIIGVLDTTVHEMLHGIDKIKYNSQGVYKHSYYAGSGEMITVEYTDPWDSVEMAQTLPEACRVFRWSTYINTTDNMASNIHGIYGILEEFTAYSFGMNTSTKMFNFFKENASVPEDWQSYINRGENGKQAWAEFMSFMAGYLKYSAEHYPETYNSIINNTAFKTQVHRANKVFTDAITSYDNSLSEVEQSLIARGYDAEISDDKFSYTYKHGRTVRTTSLSRNTTEYNNILSVLRSADFAPYYNMIMSW